MTVSFDKSPHGHNVSKTMHNKTITHNIYIKTLPSLCCYPQPCQDNGIDDKTLLISSLGGIITQISNGGCN